MVAPSNQVAQQLAAGAAFLEVVLAERTGPLNELQRELLASTLTRVQHAAALLQTALADAMDTLDASVIGKLASDPKQPDLSLSP
jgi:hypothetical protein